MIGDLNLLVEHLEENLAQQIDVAALARDLGTTEYHLRRMFSAVVGMPVTEYVRRRRMTLAAADVMTGTGLLDVAVKFGYGSAEAFGRAFAAVHGATPGEVRRDGGPLSTQQRLRFRMTVFGTDTFHTRIAVRPAFRLIGHTTRVPLIHEGTNPHIVALIASLSPDEHARLKGLGTSEPQGLLQITDDVDPDAREGSELTYMHGVAVDTDADAPADLAAIDVAAGRWAVFRASGAYPAALQALWASTATEWFPSNPWRLRPGPSIVAVLERSDDFSTATVELWLPVEPA